MRNEYPHVAVQLNPDEERFRSPVQARRYLEKYFDRAKISIFWGSSEDFLRGLGERLTPRAG
jgi:hypothetical protein